MDISSIETEIVKIQQQIKDLTEQRSVSPLPPVPMLPNLARGSAEMWQIYQFQLERYQTLQNIPTEAAFLKQLLNNGTDLEARLRERLQLLTMKQNTTTPILQQPLTKVNPLPYDQKIQRAKLIAKHISRNAVAEPDRADQIKSLQNKLMDLETMWLEK